MNNEYNRGITLLKFSEKLLKELCVTKVARISVRAPKLVQKN